MYPYNYRMSNKTFTLLILMWVAWILLGMSLIDTGHWILVGFNTLVAMILTFFAVD